MFTPKLVCRLHLRMCPAVNSCFVAAQLAVQLLQDNPARHLVHDTVELRMPIARYASSQGDLFLLSPLPVQRVATYQSTL